MMNSNREEFDSALDTIISEWQVSQQNDVLAQKGLQFLGITPPNYEILQELLLEELWNKARPFCRAATHSLGLIVGSGGLGVFLGGISGGVFGVLGGGLIGGKLFGMTLLDEYSSYCFFVLSCV